MDSIRAMLLVGMVTAMAATSQQAVAEKCNGLNSVKGEPFVELFEKADGSKVYFTKSNSIINVKMPSGAANDGALQVCVGLWTLDPDGKSVGGAGDCYTVDKDGDTYSTSWQRSVPATGTWKRTWGTGKYEGSSSSGTYESQTIKYGDGFSTTAWEGDCMLTK